MKTIVLASRNKDKIKELRQTLKPLHIDLQSTYDFPDLEEVEEDRGTLHGNALKKAEYTFKETGTPSLADDTGLEVDALDGRPGVYSARYAGEKATYRDNLEKLLEELKGVPLQERTAQLRTVAAFVTEDGPETFEGICRGKIIQEEQGDDGFGYDPIFKPKGYEQTFAELLIEEKNAISHRAKAIDKFVDWLQG